MSDQATAILYRLAGKAPAPLALWMERHGLHLTAVVSKAVRRASFGVIQGGGTAGRAAAEERAEGPSGDLAASIQSITDPRSRTVLTAAGAGIPMTSIVLDYTESGLIPEGTPFRSVKDAEHALNWLNVEVAKTKAPNDKSYRKTVFSVTWADGSVWRGRFDVDGTWQTNDLFGEEHGGGITWENTTRKDKVYARDTVFPNIPPFKPGVALAMPSLNERWAAALARKGLAVGPVYLSPRHMRADDSFQDEDHYLRILDVDANGKARVEEQTRSGQRYTSNVPIAFLLERKIDPQPLPDFPPISGDKRLTSLVDWSHENEGIRLALQTLAPGTTWKVTKGRGTSSSWSDVKFLKGDRKAALAAATAMGLDADIFRESGASVSRSTLFVPAAAVPVVKAFGDQKKAEEKAETEAQKASRASRLIYAKDFRPGDLLVRLGMYNGPALIDVVRVTGHDAKGNVVSEHVAMSETWQGQRVLSWGKVPDKPLKRAHHVEAPDFTPKALQARGGAILRKYMPAEVTGRVIVTGRNFYHQHEGRYQSYGEDVT